ncbi:putative ef-hand superfamily ca2+-modulated protein [Golovinomyces cichoracearum]|uniref:Putative ef-hand superfamily ca2+-modulated protein n=1 Tax=Golovinomyces cichoracearum TaxID=62708 RepID=A0A420IXC8_9PEZI|nr:putative ef-hand superfamily ca2+-modulated protein [Golovinomyces cichoracearum]
MTQAYRTKLAQKYGLLAVEEQEIYEAFSLFPETTVTASNQESYGRRRGKKSSSDSSKHQQKVFTDYTRIRTQDLRRCLNALSFKTSRPELKQLEARCDPEMRLSLTYESFVDVCAQKLRSRSLNDEDHQREVDEAWALFVREGEKKITTASLREVANAAKVNNVSDDLLDDMILEANGGAGIERGVDKAEFESVMRKAGVWR